MSHASHCPLQIPSQQYESTQCEFVHWSSALQRCPFAFFGWHCPEVVSHQLVDGHPASVLQGMLHALPAALHPGTPHIDICGAGQLPMPSQLAPVVSTPPMQFGARH
jgi:hypothetical protein